MKSNLLVFDAFTFVVCDCHFISQRSTIAYKEGQNQTTTEQTDKKKECFP